jgi:hypothetical protein
MDQIKEYLLWLNAVSISATGVIAGSNKLVHPFREALLILNVTQVPQTSPELLIEVETSFNDSDYFFHTVLADKLTQGSLTRITAPTNEHKIRAVGSQSFWLLNMGKFIRLNVTAFSGSGSPATFTATALLGLYGRS